MVPLLHKPLIFHISRAEYMNVPFNVILLVLAGVVAYGRWRVRPLKDRAAAA